VNIQCFLYIYNNLTVNTSGTPRLTKFYTPLKTTGDQSGTTIPQRIFKLISSRPVLACNFLDVPDLDLNSQFITIEKNDRATIVYRNYATLFFVFVVDGAESQLGILDLIQVSATLLYIVMID
jgi:AP-3 complex subunit sigma